MDILIYSILERELVTCGIKVNCTSGVSPQSHFLDSAVIRKKVLIAALSEHFMDGFRLEGKLQT